MLKPEKRYKTFKTKELWEAPTPKEENLFALGDRFTELKKKLANKLQVKYDGNIKTESTKKSKNQPGFL